MSQELFLLKQNYEDACDRAMDAFMTPCEGVAMSATIAKFEQELNRRNQILRGIMIGEPPYNIERLRELGTSKPQTTPPAP